MNVENGIPHRTGANGTRPLPRRRAAPPSAPRPRPAKPRSRWLLAFFNFRFFSDSDAQRAPHAVLDPSARSTTTSRSVRSAGSVRSQDRGGCRLLNSVTIIGRRRIGARQRLLSQLGDRHLTRRTRVQGRPHRADARETQLFREASPSHRDGRAASDDGRINILF